MTEESKTPKIYTFITDGESDHITNRPVKSEKIPPTPEEVLDHVLKVGKEKPLGYLPTREIEEYCKTSVEKLRQQLKLEGL